MCLISKCLLRWFDALVAKVGEQSVFSHQMMSLQVNKLRSERLVAFCRFDLANTCVNKQTEPNQPLPRSTFFTRTIPLSPPDNSDSTLKKGATADLKTPSQNP